MTMSPEMYAKLRKLIVKHEGFRNKLYQDSLGKWTIGIGYCIENRGVENDVISHWFNKDIEFFNYKFRQAAWFLKLNEARQIALMDMAFNLGWVNFLEFNAMIEALEKEDFETAAKEMLNSKWASQVGERANELANIILTGVCDII